LYSDNQSWDIHVKIWATFRELGNRKGVRYQQVKRIRKKESG